MPKRRKPAPRRSAPERDVCRLKSSPATFFGRVTAKDKDAAIVAAIEQFAMSPRHQKRLLALRRAAAPPTPWPVDEPDMKLARTVSPFATAGLALAYVYFEG